MQSPLITIITSTLNAGDELKATAESVRSQNYRSIQWIVADGGSSDSTLKVLEENSDIIDIWFTEADEGIYDAWNKAIGHARGQWLLFLGAGDRIASPDTLLDVAIRLEKAYPDHVLAYGDVEIIDSVSLKTIRRYGKPWSDMRNRWVIGRPELPPHPGVFHHRSLMNGKDTFDIRYRIAGDSEFLLRHIYKRQPLYIPMLIDLMPDGGVSTSLAALSRVKVELEQICLQHNLTVPLVVKMKAELWFLLKRIQMLVLPR